MNLTRWIMFIFFLPVAHSWYFHFDSLLFNIIFSVAVLGWAWSVNFGKGDFVGNWWRSTEIGRSFYVKKKERMADLDAREREADHKLEIQRERQQTEKEAYKYARKGYDAEYQGKMAPVEKIKAEAFDIIQNANITVDRRNIIKDIVKEVDLKTITPQQANILIRVLNPNSGTEDIDPTKTDEWVANELERAKAETDQVKATAKLSKETARRQVMRMRKEDEKK